MKKLENTIYAYFIFMIWPFLSIGLAIWQYKEKWAKNIIWVFIVFYSFTFVISREGIDASRYRDSFIDYTEESYSNSEFYDTLYSEETNNIDILHPLLSYIVSKFTNDYRVLFAVFGLIFGYFYSRNIWYLLNKARPFLKTINIPIIVTFAFIIGFWQINGFRFWTAAHMFFFSVLPYLIEGKKKYLWLSVLTILVHFSFIIPVFILLSYIFLGNRLKVFFSFFLVSLFISEINFEVLNNYLSFFPEVFAIRSGSYINEEYKMLRAARSLNINWYVLYYAKALRWVVIGLIILIYFKGNNFFKENKKFLNLFSFSLLFYGIANIISNIPSGSRFITIANLFMVAFIFFYLQFQNKDTITKMFVYISLPALLLFNIVSIRNGFDTIGLLAVIGNPVIALLLESNIALIDLIK